MTQPFQRLWPSDPYAVARTGALRWLGDRYLLAKPVKRKPKLRAESPMSHAEACFWGDAK